MANMETFYKGLMASENVISYVGSTKFQKNGKDAEIHDGALVVLGELAPSTVYGENAKDDNVFLSAAPTATTDDVVIVDISSVSGGKIAGNYYKEGIKLVGLRGMEGEAVRYRVPMKHDKFYVSADCFVGTPVIGQYATPTANDTKFTPAADKAAAGFCVKILDSRDFTVGNQAFNNMYLCMVL